MKVVVLGAGGQLGQALATRAAETHDTLAWTRAESDVTQPSALAERLRHVRPDVIFNGTAFTQVDLAEDRPVDALAVNAVALRDLAAISTEIGATLVHYSTDFVFDGDTPGLHAEDAPTGPRGTYATSKLIGEWFAAETPRHYVLRVESLFGGAGASSIDVMLANLRAGRPVKAFSDRTVSPSFVRDVANASITLVERAIPFGVYHCVNSGWTTWTGIAEELARLSGTSPSLIEPIKMAGMTMRVSRPLHAAMSNAKLCAAGIEMPTWQNALERYVE